MFFLQIREGYNIQKANCKSWKKHPPSTVFNGIYQKRLGIFPWLSSFCTFRIISACRLAGAREDDGRVDGANSAFGVVTWRIMPGLVSR